jgi:hypothetical protein
MQFVSPPDLSRTPRTALRRHHERVRRRRD